MKVRVINASENLKKPAEQIAMMCRLNLRMATSIEMLVCWADGQGFNQLKWEKVNALQIRIVFQDCSGDAAFEVSGI